MWRFAAMEGPWEKLSADPEYMQAFEEGNPVEEFRTEFLLPVEPPA